MSSGDCGVCGEWCLVVSTVVTVVSCGDCGV